MQTRTVILAAGLALVCSPARAEDGKTTYDPRVAFGETDVNKDGVIDHAEFQERITYIFYRADTNKDGYLDVIELRQLEFSEDFTHDDKDKDGRVSLREFLCVRFHDFDVEDTDHDGVLSLDEVVAAYEGRTHK